MVCKDQDLWKSATKVTPGREAEAGAETETERLREGPKSSSNEAWWWQNGLLVLFRGNCHHRSSPSRNVSMAIRPRVTHIFCLRETSTSSPKHLHPWLENDSITPFFTWVPLALSANGRLQTQTIYVAKDSCVLRWSSGLILKAAPSYCPSQPCTEPRCTHSWEQSGSRWPSSPRS